MSRWQPAGRASVAIPASEPLRRPDYDVGFMPTGSTHCHQARRLRGLTLIETLLSMFLIAALISILLPALNSARMASYRDQCGTNQRRIGQAWQIYLNEHNREFPYVPCLLYTS